MRKSVVLSVSICALAASVAAAGLAGSASAARAGAGAPAAGSVAGGIISTVAGGVGGPGLATLVGISPCGVRWAGGWLYIGDGSMVRRVSMATDALTTVTGDNAAGPLDGSGTAAASPLGGCSTTLDAAGNLVIPAGGQVLAVAARTGTFYGQAMTAGHAYVIAGGGGGGDGGPATSAALNDAEDVAFDQSGNLLIADSGSGPDDSGFCAIGSLVRVVAAATGTFYGQAMTAGDIYTVAGAQTGGCVGGGSGPATSASLGETIGSVRPDPDGNLIVTEAGEPGFSDGPAPVPPFVQVVAAVTGTFYGIKMTAGNIYTVAGNGHTGSGGDGGLGTRAPLGLAGNAVPGAAGNLVIADSSRVRVVAARTGRFYGQAMTAGHIYGIAGTGRTGYSGDGGPAVSARVAAGSVTVDAAGNILLAGSDQVGTMEVRTGTYRVRAIAARTGTFYGIKMTAGHIYTIAGTGTGFSGGGGPPLRAEITDPTGVSVDGAGDIAVTGTSAFVKGELFDFFVDTTVDLIAARSGTLFGRRLTAGQLYTVAGNGISGFRGDKGPARNAEFCITGPNVFEESGVPDNGASLAFGGSGNLLVADGCNNRVRLIAVRSGRYFGQAMKAGDVYTIAGTGRAGFSGDGGPAVTEQLNDPAGAGIDHHGNVLIADTMNNRVRLIAGTTGTFYGQKMAGGHIYTIAGVNAAGSSGDGGPAIRARLAGPVAVAADHHGNVLIADQGNDRVRVIAAATGTFYGRKMTAGHIYTIVQTIADPNGVPSLDCVTIDRHGNVIFTDPAGAVWVRATTDGTFYGQAMTAGGTYQVAGGGATLGDGGPATSALLANVGAVAVSPAGTLLVADGSDNRLRAISP